MSAMNKFALGRCLIQRCSSSFSSYGGGAIYDVLEDGGTSSDGYQPPGRQQRHPELLELNKLFPDIVRDLTENEPLYQIEDSNKWLAKALQYNMAAGGRTRGVALVESLKILSGNDENQLQKARILAWCLEMLHTSMWMSHDALMRTESRSGKTCWYLKKELSHDNSPRIIEAAVYRLLQVHFGTHPAYASIIDLFHAAMSKVMMGQSLEQEARSDRSLSQFTMERYSAITKYTTSHVHFELPVLLAITLAGIKDQEVYRQAKTVLQEMGFLYQAQKDFIDCYGRSEPRVDPGTGIQDGKCTWMSVVALQRVSDTQRKIFMDCYGQKDEIKVATIKEIYNLVGVRSTYKRFEEMNSELLLTQIQQVSRGLPHKLFHRFLKKSPLSAS